MHKKLFTDAVTLLQQLIAVPSFSKEEAATADLLMSFFKARDVQSYRDANNVWASNRFFDPAKPTVLLNSHHDTVRPNPGYTRDPFNSEISDSKLYGLGSNDAGGPLVALIATFMHYFARNDLSHNIVLAATAEEEISGRDGIERIWSRLPAIDFAIVGEPTLCDVAIAEKGLMVLDCFSKGKAGHAAREEGINALYAALPDIEWFRTFKFPKVSESLGDMKMSVTIIHAGTQHNVVPSECKFTVDVRVTDVYELEEALDIIRAHVSCEVTPRSLRMRSSGIQLSHPIVQSAQKLRLRLYGSPTTSDQALIPVPSIKIGPGDSARSHSADEFIFVDEVEKGIETYVKLLNGVILQ
jgi:acetylornithine deacetylase/succinyl-diaminopimelate desuccinylase-like protein